MKAILYVGGALMVAASIYGFIDYKKSSHDKKFRELYENRKDVSVPAEKREVSAVKEEPVKISKEKTESSATNKEQQSNSSTTKRSGKKIRKIKLEEFSRAKLEDKPLIEEIKIEPKKEEVKVAKKEQ